MTFCKRLRGLLSLAILASCALLHAQTKPDINRYTVGDLPTSRLNAPGIAGLCLLTDGNAHVSIAACPAGSGSSGSGTFPQSLANASHKWLNSYDSTTGLFTQTQPASTALADFSATPPTAAGKIPIFDPAATNSAGGTGAYVPGDPLVQGLLPDGSTTAGNPVAIGGYDTAGTPALHRALWINGNPAGTEYGLITRNIPSGTQTIAGTVTANQGSAGASAWKVDGSSVTQPVSAASLPLPSGASTSARQPAFGTSGTPSPDVITVQGASSMTALKTDGSAVTQPVSAASLPLPAGAATSANQPALVSGRMPVDPSGVTSPVSVASLPLPSGAAQDATLTGGTAKAINRGGVKGTTTAADVTSTASGANHQALDVAQYDASGNQLGLSGSPVRTDPTGSTTQPVSAATLPLPAGAATSANQPALKSDNAGTPGATNEGVLPSVANVAPPSRTEGNQAALSVDLHGNLRVYGHPPDVLGCYMVNGRTGTYAALAAGSPLYSFRWTSSTALAVIMRVKVSVTTVTAATVAGQAERELIVARSFSVSDTGGTAVTLTGNNQKMRTSMATSLVGDMRFGQPLTAGTRTLDSAPIASAVAWLPLLFTGVDIGCGGAANTTTANSCMGGIGMIELLNATNGQDYPLVLAQNEGFIVRIGKDAQPTTAVQQTYVNVSWCEVNAF
jgi:hypothetical protein